MATTTNYSWTTPDDTDLVKDGASAIRSLGTAIDSTVFTNAGNAVQKSTIDAKGDLLVGTADNTVGRLAVGTNNYVLTADSAETSGMKWAAAAGGGLNWTLINTGGTSLTGAATITVSGISDKEYILVLVDQASSASADSIIGLRINTDTGTNYSNFGGLIASAGSYSAANFTINAGTTQTYQPIGRMSSSAGSVVAGGAFITGGKSTGIKSIQSMGAGTADGNNQHRNYTLTGIYNGSAALTSVSLFSDTGNFDAGTLYVYGA